MMSPSIATASALGEVESTWRKPPNSCRVRARRRNDGACGGFDRRVASNAERRIRGECVQVGSVVIVAATVMLMPPSEGEFEMTG